MATVGRPPLEPLDQATVRHMDTGHAVAWCNGVFSGDKELVRASRIIHEAGEPVSLGPVEYPVTNDVQGATVAMLAACCGRGVVATGPSLLSGQD